jgi:hypothetical protein
MHNSNVVAPPHGTHRLPTAGAHTEVKEDLPKCGEHVLQQAATKAQGLTVRSIRRGALTLLALADYAPEEIRLLSRRTTDKGLYAYLDDGLYALWEHKRTVHLAKALWHNTESTTQ